ncbi:hypothetical protein JXO59_15525, partial [candidate division KSB1 bacterium]|nr:hypothetical protein [candidate division KSB1 bacterium]
MKKNSSRHGAKQSPPCPRSGAIEHPLSDELPWSVAISAKRAASRFVLFQRGLLRSNAALTINDITLASLAMTAPFVIASWVWQNCHYSEK